MLDQQLRLAQERGLFLVRNFKMLRRAAKQQRIDDGRAPALRRLQSVTSVRSTSSTALGEIVGRLSANAPSKKALTDARQALFASIHTTLPLEQEGGGIWHWPLCHPGHLLTRFLSESKMLQEMFADALRKFPCSQESPWDLVVMFDEFTPGNKLQALQNHRKVMNLSFSFEQLGLQCESRLFQNMFACSTDRAMCISFV